LCYSPEFIALGSVIRDMLEPDMVLIGESDPRAGDVLERLYAGVCENDPPFRRMSLVNAELTKIAVNTYVTMKISYANALADMCERLAGADVEVVTDALGLDTRIGSKYLRGGLAYGGPCFPRDNKAFGVLARDLGAEPLLAEATDAVNVAQTDRLARVVQSRLEPGSAVGILGLAYKPDTAVVEESPGVALAAQLANAGYDVRVYDPVATEAGLRALGGAVRACASAGELLEQSDVTVITTAWPEFAELPLDAVEREGGRVVVIDCWRLLPEDRARANGAVEIVQLGRPIEEASPV
jgi:UDPglucose 6-dehydrogenase